MWVGLAVALAGACADLVLQRNEGGKRGDARRVERAGMANGRWCSSRLKMEAALRVFAATGALRTAVPAADSVARSTSCDDKSACHLTC